MHKGLRLTIVLALAACYVVGRLVLLWLPGVSFSYLVLFLAGIAFGPRVGASVGVLGRVASDLVVSGLNPIFLPMALVDLVLGTASGVLGRVANVGQHRPSKGLRTYLVLANAGLFVTAAYSVLADTITWLFYNFILTDAPSETRTALFGTLVLMGLAFNVPAIVFNTVLFPSVVPPILHNLDAAGLLVQPAPKTSELSTPLPSRPS